jgi:hypothetical protein
VDGRAGEDADALDLLLQCLDDDLLRVLDVVDDEPELTVVGLQHDDERAPPAGRCDSEPRRSCR